MLFGVRFSSLFTSRWMALLWAILVILTAIQFVAGQKAEAPDNSAAANETAPAGLTPEEKAAIDRAF